MKKTFILLLFLQIIIITTCKKEELKSNEKEITSFNIDGQIDTSIIDITNSTVIAKVSQEKALTNITPVITISEKATINPASGSEIDFSQSPVIYKVTAENGSVKDWMISVDYPDSSNAEIISFTLANQTGTAVISGNIVTAGLPSGSDLTNVAPVIEIAQGATISPASGETVDFSDGSVVYTVTASNGYQKVWNVTVSIVLSKEANILGYLFSEQSGGANIGVQTVFVEVPSGTDVSSVAPSISISPKATIAPESGTLVDFSTTGYVDYSVKAESGKTVAWRVFLDIEYFNADDPNIQYTGRIDFTNPKQPKYWAPGVYIKAKFSGTYCDILIYDENANSGTNNYIDIVVDETNRQRIQLSGKKNTIQLVTGLADGEHTLLICKDTEVGMGYMQFLGLRCDNLLTLPEKPVRKIEFIGNSITCGTGIDQSQYTCGSRYWYDQHNAYMSYGPRIARSLNAQWHLSSVSGIGLMHSCCGMTYVMPTAYNKIKLYHSGDSWDFSRYVPDVVTISLGQNDGIQDSTVFCTAYINFIKQIRSHYPDANIVCLTSPMANAELTNVLKNYLTGIVNHMVVDELDSEVSSYFFSQSYNSGCDTHPDISEHELIATELEIYLKDLLNW